MIAEDRSRWRRARTLSAESALALAMALFVLYPANPSNMPVPISRDTGVFLYGGWRLLAGELPYRDVWDHKPPVIFFINAFGLALAGGSRWGGWAVEALSLGIAVFIALRLLRGAFGTVAATAALYLGLMATVFLLEGGNFTTEFTLPMQFAALALMPGARGARLGWRAVLIGALCGAAFFTKQNTIGVGAAIGAYLLFTRLRAGQSSALIRDGAMMAAGALAAGVVILAPFAAGGALGALWDAAFVYNYVYGAATTANDRLAAFGRGLVALQSTNLTGLALAGWGFGLLRALRRNLSAQNAPLVAIALIDLPIELALVSASGRSFAHYYLALLPPFMILAAFAVHTLTEAVADTQVEARRRAVARLGTLAALALACVGLQIKSPLDYAAVIADAAIFNRAQLEIVEYVRRNSAETDAVLVLGAETQINFLAGRRAPTRFVYQYPLSTPGYTSIALVEEFFDDLVQRRPRLIVDMTGQGLRNTFGFDSPRIMAGLSFLQSHCAARLAQESWAAYECITP